jgi:hypothetical protein
MSANPAAEAATRVFHFDLSFLGPDAETTSYTLRAFGKSYTLRKSHGEPGTHQADNVAVAADRIQMIRVYGPPNGSGIPSLALSAIYHPNCSATFGPRDIARSILFSHPQITVLTAQSAEKVIAHIDHSSTLGSMEALIGALGSTWNQARTLVDNGSPARLRRDGTPHYAYDLNSTLLNLAGKSSREAKARIYSDPSLENIRWRMQPGISCIDRPAGRDRVLHKNGYHYTIQDGGPNYGVSATIVSVDADHVVEIKITNNYIRHLSVFASFVAGDDTQIPISENFWGELLRAATKEDVWAWIEAFGNDDKNFVGDKYHRYLGNVGPEMTFLGVPVSSSSSHFTFQLPLEGHSLKQVRILCGSLGLPTDIEGDLISAWIGMAMTGFLDLAIPGFTLVASVGEQSNTLFENLLNKKFLGPTLLSLGVVIMDLVNNSPDTGNDVEDFFVSLGDRVLGKILDSADILAELAVILGAEEVEESIPVVGWAFRVIAVEGTIAQLTQTICEIAGSPRAVEFDLRISMDAEITLRPKDKGHQAQFAATADHFTITAQYSDVTARTFNGRIDDPKVARLTAFLNDIPVGGTVTFAVAVYSAEGWLVGKGTTPAIKNEIGEGGVLKATMDVAELLYPLNGKTTYHHEHLLGYEPAGYRWTKTDTAPVETVANLGSGDRDHVLEGLAGIALNADLGVVGCAWQASGMNIPSIDGDVRDVVLWAFRNVGNGSQPDAAYMATPKGYDQAPKLLYMRTTPSDREAGCFYLDPTGGPKGGFHLRRIVPVTDPGIALDDPRRRFDQSRGESWGRFGLLPGAMAIHSNGYVVAIADYRPTLQILRLSGRACPNDQAPWANIVGGPGTRAGLLADPALIAISPNQTILVLERGNHRVQAFSRGGHPVPAFTAGSGTPAYWFPLENDPDVTYLSMTVEIKGYIYISYHTGNGYDIDQFHLDIYTPEGTRLVQQTGFNNAAAAVDLWRNLYALNYQTIRGPGGRTEPSLSEWIPRTPA